MWGEDLAGSRPVHTCVLRGQPVLCPLGIPVLLLTSQPPPGCWAHSKGEAWPRRGHNREGRAGTCRGCHTPLGIAWLLLECVVGVLPELRELFGGTHSRSLRRVAFVSGAGPGWGNAQIILDVAHHFFFIGVTFL